MSETLNRISEICKVIGGYNYRFTSEEELQDGIETILKKHGISHVREAILGPRDRIDFMSEGVGIEVKIKGSLGKVTRQLDRYAKLDIVSGLILVTSRIQLDMFPSDLHGKPFCVVALVGSIL